MEVVTTGAIRGAKLQSNRHHQQTNTQLFTGRMPFLSFNQQVRVLWNECKQKLQLIVGQISCIYFSVSDIRLDIR